MVSVWTWPSRRQRRRSSSTGQLIIYKGPTVRRSTAARRLRGGCSGGSAGRVRRCPTSSGTLYSLPARRSPTCGACSLGCGASEFVIFRLSRSHRKYLYQYRYLRYTVPRCAIKTLLGVQLSFVAHCERKYAAAFGAKSSAGCPERTGSGNSGIILAQSRECSSATQNSSVNASRSDTKQCVCSARKPRGRRSTSTR